MLNLLNSLCLHSFADLFFAVGQLAYLSMRIVCTTTMLAQICLGLCKHHFSSATWLVSAMASSWCLELLVFEQLCFLFATYIGPSSASSTGYSSVHHSILRRRVMFLLTFHIRRFLCRKVTCSSLFCSFWWYVLKREQQFL